MSATGRGVGRRIYRPFSQGYAQLFHLPAVDLLVLDRIMEAWLNMLLGIRHHLEFSRTVTIVTMLVASLLVHNKDATAQQIRWQSGTTDTKFVTSDKAAEDIASFATLRGGQHHMVLQFDSAVTPSQKSELAGAGIKLLTYLGDEAYFAAVESDSLNTDSIRGVQSLRAAMPTQRDWKLHTSLIDDVVYPWAIVDKHATSSKDKADDGNGTSTPDDPTVAVYAIFHKDVDLGTKAVSAALTHGARIRSHLESINGLVLELPKSQIKLLADEDAVQWIEPPLPKMSELNNDNRVRTQANVVQAAPYNLDGSGVSVLVYDGGYGLASHPDFSGRLTVRDSSGLSDHSTHVAGTVGGDGTSSSGLYRGMAPGVTIESYGYEPDNGMVEGFLYTDPGDIEDDYSEAISVYGADISNNSIGTNTAPNGFPCSWEGNYHATSQMIDTIVRGDGSNPLFNQPFRIIWANGNERGGYASCGSTYHTTAPPACAKNHITVGALNSDDDSVTYFTSWGPTDDDRIKPDISAPGCQNTDDEGVTSTSSSGGYTEKCGTSMAAPTVTGLAALILQDFRDHFPGEPDFRNSTLKIFLAHTAEDIEETGPDYKTGYGSVRVQDAIDFMRTGNFLEETVDHDDTISILGIVNPGDSQLKVTLAWDDVPGAANTIPELVNDLDLKVFDSSGTQYYPWTLGGLSNPSAPAVRTQPDRINNIEQVVVDNPTPGAYRIEIHGYNVPSGPQPFSICVSPSLVACSPQGIVSLDRAKYACSSTATLQVVDCDLNTDDTVTETVSVNIASTTDPTGKTVLLTETGPETAAFLATIPLATTEAPETLLIAEGDTVTVTYIDADDGSGGTNVPAYATAIIDCVAPVISNIQVTDLLPRSATVTFTTDEPANCTVRYGESCLNLNGEAGENAFSTSHTLTIKNLQDSHTYYFAIDAMDQAGNASTNPTDGSCHTFSTPDIPDFFTEEFGTENDLGNFTITFTPNGSVDFYDACVESITALPTDPSGGNSMTFSPSIDDGYSTVYLSGGASVSLYGVNYSTFYPATNGYLTFNDGDNDYDETLAEHFSQPRISAVYDDFDPGDGGSVTWKQLADRVAVTWLDIHEYDEATTSTFQIEMFFDGKICISYLDIASEDGIAGLSSGAGLDPDYYESDISEYGPCHDTPPTAMPMNVSTAVSTPMDIALAATDDGMPEPSTMSYIVKSLPSNGTLSEPGYGTITTVPHILANGDNQVSYSPNAGFSSLDSFRFAADDGGAAPYGGESSPATVSITVGGPDWNPVAYNSNETTGVSIPLTITLTASDPNSDTLVYYIESLPSHGSLADPRTGQISAADLPHRLGRTNSVVYQPPCGEIVADSFTFTAMDDTAKSNAATVSIIVTSNDPRMVYEFSMDTDPGWTTEGLWAYGQPIGAGSHHKDPTSGFTGNNVYGYNLYGDYQNNQEEVYSLTTNPIDCENLSFTELKFQRWLGVERYDQATIEVSVDGGNWITIWDNPSTSNVDDDEWTEQAYNISDIVDGQSNVRIRWTIGTTDSSTSFPGWNIDDVEIWALVPPTPADFNGDGAVNARDFPVFYSCLNGPDGSIGAGCVCIDLDEDGDIDLQDFAVFQAVMQAY